jgi:hypothetical protein
MSTLFKRRNLQEYTDSLAAYLPGGELFASKNIENSNFRKLLQGLATELFRSNGLLREYSCEILPDETQKFVDEWESAVGIPDDCFNGLGSIEERRRDILLKLASLGIQTIDDFQDLANRFDILATVYAGEDSPFPVATPKFTIVVDWLGTTPEQSQQINILNCLFKKVKPANVVLEIFNQNRFAQCGELEMQCGEEFAECNNSLF